MLVSNSVNGINMPRGSLFNYNSITMEYFIEFLMNHIISVLRNEEFFIFAVLKKE